MNMKTDNLLLITSFWKQFLTNNWFEHLWKCKKNRIPQRRKLLELHQIYSCFCFGVECCRFFGGRGLWVFVVDSLPNWRSMEGGMVSQAFLATMKWRSTEGGQWPSSPEGGHRPPSVDLHFVSLPAPVDGLQGRRAIEGGGRVEHGTTASFLLLMLPSWLLWTAGCVWLGDQGSLWLPLEACDLADCLSHLYECTSPGACHSPD